jgi:uncharacterized protein involved in exopolysaccharide biosynthesis
VQEVLNRNQQNKMMMETNLTNLRNQLNSIETTEAEVIAKARVEGRDQRLAEAEKRVSDSELALIAMRETLRPEHPDLRAAVTRLETLKKERDRIAAIVAAEQEAASATQTGPTVIKKTNPIAVKSKAEIEGAIAGVNTQLHAIDLDSEDRVKMQKVIMSHLQTVSDRIQSNPLMQGEYAQLTRDYGLAKDRYDRLSTQKSSSEVANRLEDRSAGEQLEVLDSASLPQKASEPNRWIIVGSGTAIGLILGLCLAGAQEVKNSTMKGLKDVRAYSNMNILSSIPLLENALLVRRKRRLTWLAWSSSMIVGIMVMCSSVYYYYWGH